MYIYIRFFSQMLDFYVCYVIAKYQPGTPGAEWTDDEVDIVRRKVMQFLNHDWDEKREMFKGGMREDQFRWVDQNRPITEMALFRLSFHDCLTYKDGTGGCDGCLNWDKMGTNAPSPSTCQHQYEKVNKTDNNGLDRLVIFLEKIYSSTDYPPGAPKLEYSLRDTGKSRADLWQFAANVALERTIERSNFGCRHDYFQRQQVPLLEGVNMGKGFAYGVWKCKIKLNKPFKFKFGRKDCIPKYFGHPYKTEKEENHVNPHGNADEVIADVKKHLGMSARDLTALTSIHGMIHTFGQGSIGTKYTWLGSGAYLSNMYYKMLANRPTYEIGGASGFDMKANKDIPHNLHPFSIGDANGKPVAMWSMRVSCSDCWNTSQSWAGGPCTWRPSHPNSPDVHDTLASPVRWNCFGGFDDNGKRITEKGWGKKCKDVTYTPEGIQVGDSGQTWNNNQHETGGWSNMFMLNYEGGLYKKFDIDPVAFRPTGCGGIDLQNPNEMWTDGWTTNAVKTSRVNQCPKQDLQVEDGEKLSSIVEEFADDHDVWASAFLEAWQRMQSIGYKDLKDGPENSWLGYYSLNDMGAEIGITQC